MLLDQPNQISQKELEDNAFLDTQAAVASHDSRKFVDLWRQNSSMQPELAKTLRYSKEPQFEEDVASTLTIDLGKLSPEERASGYTALGELGASSESVEVQSTLFLREAVSKDEEGSPAAVNALYQKALRAGAKEQPDHEQEIAEFLLSVCKNGTDQAKMAAIENISAIIVDLPELADDARATLRTLSGSSNPEIAIKSIDELFHLDISLDEKRELLRKKLELFNWQAADSESGFPGKKITLAQQLNGLTADFPEATTRLVSDTSEPVRAEIQISLGTYERK